MKRFTSFHEVFSFEVITSDAWWLSEISETEISLFSWIWRLGSNRSSTCSVVMLTFADDNCPPTHLQMHPPRTILLVNESQDLNSVDICVRMIRYCCLFLVLAGGNPPLGGVLLEKMLYSIHGAQSEILAFILWVQTWKSLSASLKCGK